MTYLHNADILRPYGYFVPRGGPKNSFHYAHVPKAWIPYNATQFAQTLAQRPASFRARFTRPYQVAWIVSNCHTSSKREDFVAELSKYIPVKVFGRCSNETIIETSKSKQQRRPCDNSCYADIRDSYKFILGLENAHCADYVTEKFFGRVHDFVVSVNGQPLQNNNHNHYTRLAPPHSYIQAQDFATPAALAQYLISLSQNETEYLSYFWWQDYYQALAAPGSGEPQARRRFFAQSMCRLCEKLHYEEDKENDGANDDAASTSSYANVSEWFVDEGQCQVPD